MNRFATLAAGVAAAALLAGTGHAAELRTGHSSLPKGLGNPLTDASHSSGFAFMAAYDYLTYGTKDGPQPGLALSWRNTSPTTWEMKLRPNVKFHNGNTFSATDVAELVTWLNTDEGKAKGANIVRNMPTITAARAIDPLTVEITTRAPDPMAAALIATMKIVDMKHMKDMTFDNYGRSPVGTGPYRATNWGADVIDFVPFKEGWRPGKVDKLTMRALPETPARAQAFESDQIDLAFEVVPDAKERIERAAGKIVISDTPQVINLILFQNKEGDWPIKNVKVRQALNYAVNKKDYIEHILKGTSRAAGQPAASSVNGHDSTIKPYPYDPAMAKKLLAEAGFPNGFKLMAEVVANVADRRELYQAVGNDLRQIGVDAQIQEITLPALLERVANTSKFGDAQAFSFNFGAEPTMDVMRPLNALHSCKTTTKWICFPELQDTIDAANQEFDPKKRTEMLHKIMKHYHENAAAIFLYEEIQIDAVKNKIRNYKPVNRYINWHEIEIAG